MPRITKVATDKDQFFSLLAEYVADASVEAIKQRGTFTVALSGGSLPQQLGQALIGTEAGKKIEWSKWHVFFADERVVPLDHADSNYLSCKKNLFDHVTIPSSQIYTLDPSLIEQPIQAAEAYAKHLEAHLPADGKFDLLLLGMGPDGHTCSLFPEHKLLDEMKRPVAEITDSPKPPPVRITLTYPVLNKGRHALFVVTGDNKKEVVRDILENDKDYPAGRVSSDKVTWLLDSTAAALLSKL